MSEVKKKILLRWFRIKSFLSNKIQKSNGKLINETPRKFLFDNLIVLREQYLNVLQA